MTSSVLKDFTRELSNVIPHEIHHLTQHGKPFERPNCPVLLPAEGESFFQYFTQSCEVPAFLIGFRSEASESGLAIEKLIDSYLNNYIKVGKINKDESSKIKDVWLGHESWDVEEVNERLIREYIRRILLEVTSLPAQYYKKIDDAIAASQFWEESNEQAEVDIYGDNEMLSTPAIEKLRVAVQEAVNDLGMNVDIQMSSNPNGGMYNLHPGHPAWPNRWIVDAKWYISKQKPGQSTVDVEFLTSDPEILDEFDSAALVRHIAQTIRHELVHYEQMKKQAEKKDIGEIQAFQEMLDDPTQIPSDNDPKYWEVYEPTGKFDNEDPPSEIIHKEGYKHDVYVKDYLRSHIEIDAHAHDGAEELLAVYGKEDSLDMLRYGFDLEDPQLPNAIRHYWEQLSDDDPTLNKIKKKLYTQIMSLSSQQSDDVD
jgi:predicted SprT family Zn-dependent metalloprotease